MNSTTTSWKLPLAKTELGAEEIQAVREVLESGWLSMGPATEAFEMMFAQFLGIPYAVAVTNGTAALHLAHLAAGLGPGDEVICPSLSFVATANAIVYTGARPVFVDIHGRRDVNISTEEIEKAINEKTKALTVMHYGGYPCRMAELRELTDRHGLILIEDAAHAIGSSVEGSACGTWGDLGCFSFYPNKNMTCGEGGMVVTSDKAVVERLRRLRSHGMTSMTWDRHQGLSHDYDVLQLGYNYRIDELRSALGLVQLRKIPDLNHRRSVLSERYRFLLKNIDGLEVPFGESSGQSCCHLMPVILGDRIHRDRFRRYLFEQGIQTSVHYPAIHTTGYYRSKYPSCRLPLTEDISRRIVTLPLFPSLECEQVDWIVERIKTSVFYAQSD